MIQLPPFDITDAEQVPVHDYTITLEGVEYRVRLTYRERVDRWYLDLYDADDEILLRGKKLSVDYPLLEEYEIAGLPPGELALWDTSNSNAECGYEDLGVRCLLIYITEEENTIEPEATGYVIEQAP